MEGPTLTSAELQAASRKEKIKVKATGSVSFHQRLKRKQRELKQEKATAGF